MNEKLLEEMNVQINKELYSAYLYLAMAAHFEENNLGGFAHWMEKQAGEELEHAMKFFGFLNEVGQKVDLMLIDKPVFDAGSPVRIFEQVLEHEVFVTKRIHLLYDLAISSKEYPSEVFLQWFVSEQVEEERNATDILQSLRMVGDSGNAMLLIDRQLAARS
jgi:ferritin